MASLNSKIKQYVGGKIDFTSDVILQDDGQGVYIKEWNLDIQKPTLEQLEQYNDTADLNDAMIELRTKRNRLLAETDYLALSDSTLSEDMRTYRQALRDLPAGKDTVEKCENATWPTKP